jgi:hypothetical protein
MKIDIRSEKLFEILNNCPKVDESRNVSLGDNLADRSGYPLGNSAIIARTGYDSGSYLAPNPLDSVRFVASREGNLWKARFNLEHCGKNVYPWDLKGLSDKVRTAFGIKWNSLNDSGSGVYTASEESDPVSFSANSMFGFSLNFHGDRKQGLKFDKENFGYQCEGIKNHINNYTSCLMNQLIQKGKAEEVPSVEFSFPVADLMHYQRALELPVSRELVLK